MLPAAFSKIETQFTGILAGIIGATCYNKFKSVKLPDALSFFSGKRSVVIVTAFSSIVAAIILFFIWPVVFGGLVSFGKAIVSTGAIGSGIYMFLNRLLIPTGLHHALNSVFWFDVAGINDIGNFWAGTGVQGQTGMYMTGFFPFMMFGLPAAALAMYHCAKDKNKKAVYGLLLAGAISTFFTGVTEPLEFAFMFLAPGREEDDELEESKIELANNDFTAMAKIILEGLGGKENLTSIDNCVTRLRLEIKDGSKINEKMIKSAGAAGIIRPGKNSIQIIIGTKVQFVSDELKILHSI